MLNASVQWKGHVQYTEGGDAVNHDTVVEPHEVSHLVEHDNDSGRPPPK